MKHVLDRIQACVDGALPPSQVREVRSHCARCPTCQEALRRAQQTWEALADGQAPPLTQSLWPAIDRRLARQPGARSKSRPGMPSGSPVRPLARLLPLGWVSRLMPPVGGSQRLVTAGAAVLVLVVGLVLGLQLGAVPKAGYAAEPTLLQEGSLLAEGSALTLDQVYLAAAADGEEASP
jgi:anti-sigma factor RsiW